jgi:hypothetical protein
MRSVLRAGAVMFALCVLAALMAQGCASSRPWTAHAPHGQMFEDPAPPMSSGAFDDDMYFFERTKSATIRIRPRTAPKPPVEVPRFALEEP